MSDLIVLAEGFVATAPYQGPVVILMGTHHTPGGSLLRVETRPCDVALQDQWDFQQEVLRVLHDEGRLPSGHYTLQSAKDPGTATQHFFQQLCQDGQDILTSFCLAHGAVLHEPGPEAPYLRQGRYRYIYRVTVSAANQRSARIQALALLPENGWWSDLEPEDFQLEARDGNRYTLSLPITFSASGDEQARACIEEIFDGRVRSEKIMVEPLSAQERHRDLGNLPGA